MRRMLGMVGLLALLGAGSASAQLRGFINSSAGVALPISDDLPGESGGAGFAVQGQAGLWLSSVGLAAEVAQHKPGSERKVNIFGAVLRVPSFANPSIRPYLATGLGAYRYSVAGAGSRTSVGGSVGPGVLIHVAEGRLGILLEARFHATFDRQPGLNTQQFFAILGGAELGL